MHMKKAVTIVKSLLKFPKLRKKNEVKSESNKEWKEKPKLPEISIFRPCARCVLIYDNCVRKSFQRKLSQQGYCELEYCNSDGQDSGFKVTDTTTRDRQIQGFFHHHGLVDTNQNEIAICLDKSCMNAACLRTHVIWECQPANLHIQPHYPSFVFMVKSKESSTQPIFYEDFEIILFSLSFSSLSAVMNWNSAYESIVEINIEVWVLITKICYETVTLKIEENLVSAYLDYIVLMVFLDLPSSNKARADHVENLFQAVDEIMDISLYLTLANGIPLENQSYIKDTIIETATVVTSTAAESTATVGIETAAMAMGQAAAGVALSVLVDVAITAGMVTRAKIRRDKGLISQKEFQKTVRNKLCDSGCQFIGGTTGTIVGQVLIPVPVVGAIVGGFCGSLIGAGVSKGIIKTSEIISKTQASKMKAITDK